MSKIVSEARDKIIKMIATKYNLSYEKAKDLINSSFEVGEPE